MTHSVVVLNSNYEYWRDLSGEKAIRKIVNWLNSDKIEVIVESENDYIRGVSVNIKMPIVVRLLGFFGYKAKRDTVKYSKHKVFERDANICQYWHTDEHGKKFKYKCKEKEVSIDHVLPQDRGGATSFENCVCCCGKHNGMKANRTPQEAGLKLIRKPVAPMEMHKGEYVKIHFSFNPDNISHKYYMEKILGVPCLN